MLCAVLMLGWVEQPRLAEPVAVTMTPVVSGCLKLKGGSFPDDLKLSAEKPGVARRLPEGLTNARFATRKFGPKEQLREHVFVWEERDGGEARLWADANADGDLTNDAPVTMSRVAYSVHGEREAKYTKWTGQAEMLFAYSDGAIVRGAVNVTRFDPADPTRQRTKDALVLTNDFGLSGRVTLGGEGYDALLFDEMANADYRGPAGGNDSGVRLLLDLNRNGLFDRRGESFDPWKPFNVKGVTYEIRGMSASGAKFVVHQSERSVAEIAIPPDLRPGKPAPAFRGETLGGAGVRFPEDFAGPDGQAGKVVLLHFFSLKSEASTKDAGLMRELIGKHKDRLAIVSVCVDAPGEAAASATEAQTQRGALAKRVGDASAKLGMTWSVLCDGMGMNGVIASAYMPGVNPLVYVLRGGAKDAEVLASGRGLTGPELAAAVERAVAEWKPDATPEAHPAAGQGSGPERK